MALGRGKTVLARVVVVVMAASALAGCGRRGSLEPPPDAAASRDPSIPMGKTPKGHDVPDRDFFLDPLL